MWHAASSVQSGLSFSYGRSMPGFATIVLAGGASSRMGRPKALLPFGSESLVERVVRRMAAVSDEVIVVSGPHLGLPPLAAGVRVVEDEEPLEGPLSGIRYGLRATTRHSHAMPRVRHLSVEPLGASNRPEGHRQPRRPTTAR